MKTIAIIYGKEIEFPWGPIVAIHDIGVYSIIEYREPVSDKEIPAGSYRDGNLFHPYIAGEDTFTSLTSLDAALIHAIVYSRTGPNSADHIGRHFLCGLDAIKPHA